MSKKNPSGSCRMCGKATYNKYRICPQCQSELSRINQALNLIKRFPEAVEIVDETDEFNEGLE